MEMKGAVGISPAQVSGHTGGCEGPEEWLGSGPPPLPSLLPALPHRSTRGGVHSTGLQRPLPRAMAGTVSTSPGTRRARREELPRKVQALRSFRGFWSPGQHTQGRVICISSMR